MYCNNISNNNYLFESSVAVVCSISVASHTSCSKPPSSTHLTASMAPQKCAASNVDETVTTKRSRKAKQPPPAEEPILDEGEQGKDGEGDEKGKGKRGGRGTKRGRAVGKGRGHRRTVCTV